MHTPAVRQFARGVASISDCVCVGERVIHDHLTHHTPVPPPHALFELLDLPWSRWLVFTFFLPLSLSPFLLSHSPPPPTLFMLTQRCHLGYYFLVGTTALEDMIVHALEYRIAGIFRGGLLFVVFTVYFLPRINVIMRDHMHVYRLLVMTCHATVVPTIPAKNTHYMVFLQYI